MAETAEQLVVSLEARVNEFEKSFKRASKAANDNWQNIEKRGEQGAKKLESTFAQATRGVSDKFRLMATTAAGALTAAFGANELRKIADEWSQFRNRIASSGVATEDVGSKMQQLADIAVRTRSSIEGIGGAYQGIKRSQDELGASEAQVLRVTENLSKALTLGGQGAEAAKAALLQTSQALASGTLQGDELRSILENAPELAQIIASQMKVAVGQLKQLGSDGKITSKDLFEAILNATDRLDEKWKMLTPTISQSVQMLKTELTRWVGTLDQATGASSALAGGIGALAANMNVVAPAAAALAAGLAGFATGGPIVGGISAAAVALAGFAGQIHPISSELATLGDYARVAFSLIKDQGSEAATWFQAQFAKAASYVTAALSTVDAGEALAHLLAGVKETANLTIGAFVSAGHAIVAAWDATGLAITNSIIAAMNAVIAAVESAANKVASTVNKITSSANAGVGTAFPQIQPVQFGRLTGASRTAGEAVAKAFNDGAAAMKRDYVGEIGDALNRLRDKANKAAIERTFNHKPAPDDGALDAKLKSTAPKASGGAGKSAKEKSPDEFAREVAEIERKARALDQERESIGKEAIEVEKAKTAFDLLEAAKKANVAVTPELSAKVDALAETYARAKVKLDDAKQSQEAWQSGVKEFGEELRGAFESAIFSGEKLSKTIDGLLKKLASRAFENGFDALFSGITGGAGGGLFSGLKGVLGFASGGLIQGPGTGRSDSILAAVSNGEYVVNAAATTKNRGLLEALNSGRVPKFANGGFVGAPSISAPSFSMGGASGPVNVHMPITVHAQGGDAQQNADLAKQVGAAVEQHARGVVADELRRQMRPGNALWSRFSR
jgi:tape measure domain-containing protein